MEATVMFSERDLRNLVAAAATVLAMAATARAADPFTLTSTTFKDGQMMPRKVANSLSNNPNCVGQNVEDPEGRGGAGVHHWVAYGIPASVTSFAEGEVGKLSDKYV